MAAQQVVTDNYIRSASSQGESVTVAKVGELQKVMMQGSTLWV